MQDFLNSVSAVVLLMLMTAAGYLCGARGWMTRGHKTFLVRYIINIAMPCMAVDSLMGSVTHGMLLSAGPMLLVPLCSLFLCFFICIGLARLLRLERKRFGVFVAMGSVANSMFIGYPMCLTLFGEDCVFYVLCYYIINTSFFQIFGVAMLNYSGRDKAGPPRPMEVLRGVVKPPICATLACILLILLDVKLPPLALRFADMMGATVSPMAMVLTGFVIYDFGLRNLKPCFSLVVMMLVRFLLSPLLGGLFCTLFGVAGLARSVMVVEHAMPVMTQVLVLAADCGADEDYAARGTALSTVACFAVIPALMLLL